MRQIVAVMVEFWALDLMIDVMPNTRLTFQKTLSMVST